jgi:hypothetical protein
MEIQGRNDDGLMQVALSADELLALAGVILNIRNGPTAIDESEFVTLVGADPELVDKLHGEIRAAYRAARASAQS